MAGMFGLPDAAMVSQLAQKEGVPKENRVAWAVSKGWPISLIALADKYDLLQQAKQVQAQMQSQGQQPPATVAQEIDAGLASLDNPQPQPQAPQGMPPQGIPAAAPPGMPPQGGAPTPPQGGAPMPPQGGAPMPPQGGPPQGMRRGGQVHHRGPRGLRSLHAGRMETPKFARGGILAFNGEDGSEVENDEPMSDLDMMNKLSGSPAAQPAPVRQSAPSEPQKPSKPMSVQDRIGAYVGAAEKQQQNIQARLDELAKQQVFNPKVDPTLEEKRKYLLLQKQAEAHDVEKDRWQALVEMGLAMAESAGKPRLAGEGNMLTDFTAGMRAGTKKLNEVNAAYKTKQDQLEKDILAAEQLKFQAEETQRKDLYNAYKQKQADIYAGQKELDTLNTSVQNTAASLAIQAQNADTASKNAAAQLRDPAQVQMYNHILAGLQAEDRQKVAAGAKPTPIGVLQANAAKQTLTASVGVTAELGGRKLTADIVENARKSVEEQYGLGGPGTMTQEWKQAVATDRKNGNDVEKNKIKKRAYNEYVGGAMGDDTGGDNSKVIDFNNL